MDTVKIMYRINIILFYQTISEIDLFLISGHKWIYKNGLIPACLAHDDKLMDHL